MKYDFLICLFLTVTDGFQGVFWHVSDIHLNLSYVSSLNAGNGDYNSDSPTSLVLSAFGAMKRIYDKPDFVILNGDNVLHNSLSDTEFSRSIKTVSKELHRLFQNANILPSLGNHDVNPSNTFSIGSTWCKDLYSIWEVFFKNSSEEITTFKKGCFYSRRIYSHGTAVNIIVLNTMLWYSVNNDVKEQDDPLGQFNWLTEELKKSRNNGTKVFLVGHIPPGSSEYSPSVYKHFHPKFNGRLLKIMQSNSDIIDAGFFSHQHTDSFKIVYDSNEKPVVPLFLSPSVSPFHLTGLGSVNPSVRLFYWNNTSKNSRFEQYHTRLSVSLNWSLEYSSTSLLPGLSAEHLDKLVLDFTSEKSNYFEAFFAYHLSGRSHDNNEDCQINSSCRCNIICGIKNIDYNNLETCLKKCPQKTLNQWVMIASVIIVFTIVLIAVVIGANKVYCRGRRTASLTRDIYLAPYNGKNCEEIMSEHIDHIAENTFGDVPEYRGHIRNNSRTILTLNDGNDPIGIEKSQPSLSKFSLQSKNKSQEKYDYTRM